MQTYTHMVGDPTVRVLAHRSSERHHVKPTPHFTLPMTPSEGLRANGFAQFLRAQLNPSIHHVNTHLPATIIHYNYPSYSSTVNMQVDNKLNWPYEGELRERSARFDMQYSLSMSEQDHMSIYSPHKLNDIHISSHQFNEDIASSSSSSASNFGQLSIEDSNGCALCPLTTSMGYSAMTATSLTRPCALAPWNSDAGHAMLLPADCGTPNAVSHIQRWATQVPVCNCGIMPDEHWSGSAASYESQAASSVGTMNISIAEVYTPATSTSNSSDEQIFNATTLRAGQALVDLCVRESSQSPEPNTAQYMTVGDRADSPMFDTQTSYDTPIKPQDKLLRDRQLIRWREQKKSYKEIKQLGGFEEAESTLRGRYRALTKVRKDRVRKPVWTDHDVSLLHALSFHSDSFTDLSLLVQSSQAGGRTSLSQRCLWQAQIRYASAMAWCRYVAQSTRSKLCIRASHLCKEVDGVEGAPPYRRMGIVQRSRPARSVVAYERHWHDRKERG